MDSLPDVETNTFGRLRITDDDASLRQAEGMVFQMELLGRKNETSRMQILAA